ncbi:hypothetical protein N800_06810 [Lysobacter daejeonensis GH1-9]|uniref:Secreted protein n=1 Tax=Lysobacter daejeonensis GH1-9 TaxID=1385517 RepID=A0A0A0EZV1_9GAMM|nr:hypothetical protein [Lysobacter daejeonensis]KGM54682.1 hypothetical protein N800_06810 [Lysobacter daejeonensis GH1-9]
MSLYRSLAALVLAVLATALPARAQSTYVPVETRFNAEQFQAAGLHRLSPEELATLNRLLRDDQAAVVRRATAPDREQEPVRSSIAGEFRGWSRGTVFTLANGDSWQVTEGSYSVRPVSNPSVTIRPGVISGWYMEVDGHPVKAKVRRLK